MLSEMILGLLLILTRNMNGKYAKITLQRLEESDLKLNKEQFQTIRKIVLDGYAEHGRDFERRIIDMAL